MTPTLSEVVGDTNFDPLILMPDEWKEFPIKAVIQSLGKTFIEVVQKGGRVVNKSVIPVSYGRKGSLQWDDFKIKQKEIILASWAKLADGFKDTLLNSWRTDAHRAEDKLRGLKAKTLAKDAFKRKADEESDRDLEADFSSTPSLSCHVVENERNIYLLPEAASCDSGITGEGNGRLCIPRGKKPRIATSSKKSTSSPHSRDLTDEVKTLIAVMNDNEAKNRGLAILRYFRTSGTTIERKLASDFLMNMG
jgi:hypothetical protein